VFDHDAEYFADEHDQQCDVDEGHDLFGRDPRTPERKKPFDMFEEMVNSSKKQGGEDDVFKQFAGTPPQQVSPPKKQGGEGDWRWPSQEARRWPSQEATQQGSVGSPETKRRRVPSDEFPPTDGMEAPSTTERKDRIHFHVVVTTGTHRTPWRQWWNNMVGEGVIANFSEKILSFKDGIAYCVLGKWGVKFVNGFFHLN
jgi:hypothetical protein